MHRHSIPDLTPKQIARFWSRVDRSGGPAACWPWRQHLNPKGYGKVNLGGRMFGAHVVAYVLTHGQVPDGLELDHVRARGCTRRDCCNPSHLEPVTHAENMRRGAQAAQTHCKYGHEYTAQNTITKQGRPGQRQCRICHNAACYRYQARRHVFKGRTPIGKETHYAYDYIAIHDANQFIAKHAEDADHDEPR